MMDEIIKKTKEKVKQVKIGHYKLTTVKISECAFCRRSCCVWIYRERASRKSQHMEQSIKRTTDENKHCRDKNNGNNKRREKM
jgi:hypothetical protein